MLVGGVDFSGAKTIPNDTWLVTAEITDDGMSVKSVKNTGSPGFAREPEGRKDLS